MTLSETRRIVGRWNQIGTDRDEARQLLAWRIAGRALGAACWAASALALAANPFLAGLHDRVRVGDSTDRPVGANTAVPRFSADWGSHYRARGRPSRATPPSAENEAVCRLPGRRHPACRWLHRLDCSLGHLWARTGRLAHRTACRSTPIGRSFALAVSRAAPGVCALVVSIDEAGGGGSSSPGRRGTKRPVCATQLTGDPQAVVSRAGRVSRSSDGRMSRRRAWATLSLGIRAPKAVNSDRLRFAWQKPSPRRRHEAAFRH